jgi:hypothetical protein
MLNRLSQLYEKYLDIQRKLEDNSVISNIELYTTLLKEYKALTPLIDEYKRYLSADESESEARGILDDKSLSELHEIAEEELAEYEASGMLSEPPTIVVREVSVSGVAEDSDHQVRKEFANASTPIELAEGEGSGYDLLTVDPKEAVNGWSEYIYTIRSANFGEGSDSDNADRGQGVYRVNVMSDDVSSNANTTAEYWGSDDVRAEVAAKGATAEFILDELGPTIDEVDIPSHLSAGESYEASFHVTDDITSGDVVEVQVDGRTLGASEVRGPSNGTGTFSFTIPARPFDWTRDVKIVVRDYAGREASTGSDSWFWQSSFIPEGLVALGAIGAVTIIAVAVRRRKLAAEPELPI